MSYTIKTLLLIIITALSFASCTTNDKKSHTAYFGGLVTNPHTTYVIFSKDNTVIDTLPLDKNNRFFKKFDSLAPGMYSFKHDNDFQYAYFGRNDSLMVSVNTTDFDNSVVYSGRGARKNNFMMELFLQQEDDRHKLFGTYTKGFTQFKKAIDSSYTLRKAFYKENKNRIKWDSDFDYYAQVRLHLNYFSKKEYYPYLHKKYTGNDVFLKLPKDYYNHRKTIKFNDERLTKFSPFIKYTTAMLNTMAISRNKTIKQPDALANTITKLAIVDSIFTNPTIKNDVLNTLAFNYLLEDQNIINNQKFLEHYARISTDNSSDNEIKKIGKAIKQLNPGAKLPAIALTDAGSKPFNIQTDINKKTVIFFWTACAQSHLEKVYQKAELLKQQFPDLNFIAVNVDNDAEWKKNLKSYSKKDALQLRASDFEALKDKWVFTKIHRTIILNNDGTIKNAFTNLLDADFKDKL